MLGLFPKYKLKSWRVGWKLHGSVFYGIGERRFLFFYPLITFVKIVDTDGYVRSSTEVLCFRRREQAQDEIDRLNFGYPKIKKMHYVNGKLTMHLYE